MFANFANDPGHHLVRIHWEFAFNPQGKSSILLHRCHVFCICVLKQEHVSFDCLCKLSNFQHEQMNKQNNMNRNAMPFWKQQILFQCAQKRYAKKTDNCESSWSPHEISRGFGPGACKDDACRNHIQ